MITFLLAAALSLQSPWSTGYTLSDGKPKGGSAIVLEVYGEGWSLVQLIDGRVVTYGEVPRREFWLNDWFRSQPCQNDVTISLRLNNETNTKFYPPSWTIDVLPSGKVETTGPVPKETIELWRGLGIGLRQLCEGK
jgi:hypothetical protein